MTMNNYCQGWRQDWRSTDQPTVGGSSTAQLPLFGYPPGCKQTISTNQTAAYQLPSTAGVLNHGWNDYKNGQFFHDEVPDSTSTATLPEISGNPKHLNSQSRQTQLSFPAPEVLHHTQGYLPVSRDISGSSYAAGSVNRPVSDRLPYSFPELSHSNVTNKHLDSGLEFGANSEPQNFQTTDSWLIQKFLDSVRHAKNDDIIPKSTAKPPSLITGTQGFSPNPVRPVSSHSGTQTLISPANGSMLEDVAHGMRSSADGSLHDKWTHVSLGKPVSLKSNEKPVTSFMTRQDNKSSKHETPVDPSTLSAWTEYFMKLYTYNFIKQQQQRSEVGVQDAQERNTTTSSFVKSPVPVSRTTAKEGSVNSNASKKGSDSNSSQKRIFDSSISSKHHFGGEKMTSVPVPGPGKGVPVASSCPVQTKPSSSSTEMELGCVVCGYVGVNWTFEEFEKHIFSAEHCAQFKSSTTPADSLQMCCTTCDLVIRDSFLEHKRKPEHLQRKALIQKGCSYCKISSFSAYREYVRHLNGDKHKQNERNSRMVSITTTEGSVEAVDSTQNKSVDAYSTETSEVVLTKPSSVNGTHVPKKPLIKPTQKPRIEIKLSDWTKPSSERKTAKTNFSRPATRQKMLVPDPDDKGRSQKSDVEARTESPDGMFVPVVGFYCRVCKEIFDKAKVTEDQHSQTELHISNLHCKRGASSPSVPSLALPSANEEQCKTASCDLGENECEKTQMHQEIMKMVDVQEDSIKMDEEHVFHDSLPSDDTKGICSKYDASCDDKFHVSANLSSGSFPFKTERSTGKPGSMNLNSEQSTWIHPLERHEEQSCHVERYESGEASQVHRKRKYSSFEGNWSPESGEKEAQFQEVATKKSKSTNTEVYMDKDNDDVALVDNAVHRIMQNVENTDVACNKTSRSSTKELPNFTYANAQTDTSTDVMAATDKTVCVKTAVVIGIHDNYNCLANNIPVNNGVSISQKSVYNEQSVDKGIVTDVSMASDRDVSDKTTVCSDTLAHKNENVTSVDADRIDTSYKATVDNQTVEYAVNCTFVGSYCPPTTDTNVGVRHLAETGNVVFMADKKADADNTADNDNCIATDYTSKLQAEVMAAIAIENPMDLTNDNTMKKTDTANSLECEILDSAAKKSGVHIRAEKNTTAQEAEKNATVQRAEKSVTAQVAEKTMTVQRAEKNVTAQVAEKNMTVQRAEKNATEQNACKIVAPATADKAISNCNMCITSDIAVDGIGIAQDKIVSKTQNQSLIDTIDAFVSVINRPAVDEDVYHSKECNKANENVMQVGKILETMVENPSSEESKSKTSVPDDNIPTPSQMSAANVKNIESDVRTDALDLSSKSPRISASARPSPLPKDTVPAACPENQNIVLPQGVQQGCIIS